MKFSIKARVAIVGEVQEKNAFRFRDIVLEQSGAQKPIIYPLQASGDRIDLITPEMVGETIECQFYINGREYNGRHYVNLSLAGVVASEAPAPGLASAPELAPAPVALTDEKLPF